MTEYIMAKQNGRNIPLEDKIFGISRLANEMIAQRGKDAVINATLGSLIGDDGKLVVLSSVVEVLKNLTPIDYADYAPIGGIPEFKEAIKKAAFGNYEPKCFTEAIATPGGTGGIRNTIANYSNYGDSVLTSDWYWAPYNTIASEIGRKLTTYTLFDHSGNFNISSFREKVEELMEAQDSLVILLNTPAHNPTGYSLTLDDWELVLEVLKKAAVPGKSISLFIDVAYMDFAGDGEEYRMFIPLLDGLQENILPVIGYSASKTFTLYGMRCGAMICMTPNAEIAEEFKRVNEYSSRGSWSNCTRASQVVIAKIYASEKLLDKVNKERKSFRDMLVRRGKAFEKAAYEVGLEIVPFDAGFFASVLCENPDEVGKKLQEEGIFLVPLAKGLRISVASIKEDDCKMLPSKIIGAIK
ncbi:MAG: aminotransferase class I/II-fold pyridoxal phosphate-dependent enzyme [Peptostreptococcaceae bacterium]|nr:aminotransferase class I/II-fold pyridoxal phosphate-dependent enzyme [Peptostreptococcaceae bacterium]